MAVYPAKVIDRVWEQDTLTGTGALSLGGSAAAGGYLTFAQALSAGDLASGQNVRYCIRDTVTFVWETGLGAFTSGTPNTLSRTIVFQSTNANALVSFAGNLCDVFITNGAQRDNQGMMPFVAGNYYGTPGTNAPAANAYTDIIFATPLRWRGPAAPVSLSIYCSTAPTSAVAYELGIYDGTLGVPGALLWDAGSISVSAVGMQTLSPASPPVIDVPNVYLACGVPGAINGIQLWAVGTGYNGAEQLLLERQGLAVAPATSSNPVGYYGTGTYTGGALPATFPGPSMAGGTGEKSIRVFVGF